MKQELKENKLLGLFFLISIFILLCLLLILVFLLYILLLKEKREYCKTNLYQVSNLNPPSNKTNFGFARICRKLSNDEYISFNNFGSTTIVSNFFNSEYECSGSCYCDEEEKSNRKSSSIVNNGIFVVLSAISVSMAIDIAKITFQNKCQKTYSGMCSKRDVKSEVKNCEVNDQQVGNNKESERFTEIRRYQCVGHCVDIDIKKDADELEMMKKLKAKEIFGECSFLETYGEIQTIGPSQNSVYSEIQAKKAFQKKMMSMFCKRQSLVKVNVWEYMGKVKDMGNSFFRDKIPVCSAYDKNDSIENVKCKIISTEVQEYLYN